MTLNDIIYAGRHSITLDVSRHFHNTWELVYCTGGNGTFLFDGLALSYVQGDVVVIPPLTPHANRSDEGFTNIHLNLAETVLSFAAPVLIKDDGNGFILDAFNAAYFHYQKRQREPLLLSAYGSLIAALILTGARQGAERSKIVTEIENTIIHNYADARFELDGYLKSLPFSYDYLRKLFKKELGMTPHQYLSDLRLHGAADLLYSSGSTYSVSEIAMLCGFREPLYFSRMFKKKYGLSPSFYYAARREPEPERMPDPDSMKIMLDETE
jgi:AraC-like DNA-binding protein